MQSRPKGSPLGILMGKHGPLKTSSCLFIVINSCRGCQPPRHYCYMKQLSLPCPILTGCFLVIMLIDIPISQSPCHYACIYLSLNVLVIMSVRTYLSMSLSLYLYIPISHSPCHYVYIYQSLIPLVIIIIII